MNFYEHQAQARRSTLLLGACFVAAVILIVVAINAAVFAAVNLGSEAPLSATQWFAQPYWAVISAAVLLVIIGNTLFTSMRLAGGGPALARMLRARPVAPDSDDIAERRLANIVEEMSIASGVPVPALFVLDNESGINAFVAGSRPTEAVMVVTRGALTNLTRDELQGVVAHEYSHIFNHDMHLNIQLMGVLAGLLVIGQIGRLMLHSGGRSGNRQAGQLVVLGIAVLAIGYIGTFFGAVIKAAISRQREFLADASAVQYTRNPDGIAGALHRIDQHSGGSILDHDKAEDISHFCFGESIHYFLGGVMATHPPLAERIRRVHPRFEPPPGMAPSAAVSESTIPGTPPAAAAVSAAAPIHAAPTPSRHTPARLDAGQIAARVGTLAPAAVGYAHDIHESFPRLVDTALASASGAQSVIYALLLNAAPQSAAPRLQAIIAAAQSPEVPATALAAALRDCPATSRLPLINMTLPRLKLLDGRARREFLDRVDALIAADDRFTLFEFALRHILIDHLEPDAPRSIRVRYLSFTEVARPLRMLLSVLAHAGSTSESAADAAYRAAWKPFSLGDKPILSRAECDATKLHAALDALVELSPLLKQNVVRACADCVIHDFTITAAESELLQAIALSLDCPLPPLVLDPG